jgi:hypothetical protein
MRHRVYVPVVIAPLPDDSIRITGWADIGGLKEAAEETEQIATIGFGAGNIHEIEHV